MGAKQARNGNRQSGGALGIAAVDYQLHLVRELSGEQIDKPGGCCDHCREAAVGDIASKPAEQGIEAIAAALIQFHPQSGSSRLAIHPFRSILDEDLVGNAQAVAFDGTLSACQRGVAAACNQNRSG